jgi:undecaprenyl-diphosphatase
MPSSHTASAVAYTIAVGTQLPVAALPLGAVAAAVAWSRLATDRHFPSDVFVGALIGAAVGGTIATTAGLQPRFTHSPSERAASRRSEHCPRS